MGDNKGWNWGEVRHRQLGRKKCWLMTGERYKERATEKSSLSQQLLQCENPLKVNFPSSASCQYPCDQNLCRPAICFPFTLHCCMPPPGLDLQQGTLGSANLWIWMFGGWGWQGIFFFFCKDSCIEGDCYTTSPKGVQETPSHTRVATSTTNHFQNLKVS